jgi:hypothetical protein
MPTSAYIWLILHQPALQRQELTYNPDNPDKFLSISAKH